MWVLRMCFNNMDAMYVKENNIDIFYITMICDKHLQCPFFFIHILVLNESRK